jgi:hypothetical protein
MELTKQTSIAYFCKECGSASVDYGTLTGSSAVCKACGWKGTVEGLLQHTFSHESGTDDQMVKDFMVDVRKVYAANSKSLVLLLAKWGFLPQPVQPRLVGRYIAAMAQASLEAVFRVRTELEKERVEKGRTHGGS